MYLHSNSCTCSISTSKTNVKKNKRLGIFFEGKRLPSKKTSSGMLHLSNASISPFMVSMQDMWQTNIEWLGLKVNK
jgi:hypothetical protein